MRKTLFSTFACLCLFFSFTNSYAQLEPELRLIPTDCEYGMTAFLAGAGDYVASYDWGDGTSQLANWAYVDHVYDQPGVYTVTVVNDFTQYVEEVSIEDCTCPTVIEAVEFYGQCSSVATSIEMYPYYFNGYSIEWDWGDGNITNNTYSSSGYHTYDQEGEYEICAFITGPGCEEGTTLCTSAQIEFCEEPCYYGDPFIEFNESTCAYDIGLIEAPSEVLWTINGEEYDTGLWLSNVDLPAGNNLICLEIFPDLGWNCPLGYSQCFEIFVEDIQCGEPEFSFEETSCGLVQFQFELNNPSLNVASVSFGDGAAQDLTSGQNFEHIYPPFPGFYEVCISYFEEGSTFLSEYCFDVEVEGCPEEFCWMELWGEEIDCGLAQFQAFTGFNQFEETDVLWYFGDGSSEYGWSWTEHYYEEPGTYVVCAEAYSPYCENEWLFECTTIIIEGCDEECEEPLVFQEIECGEWFFSIGEEWSVEFATWDFGDGTVIDTPFNEVVSATHEYSQSGSYEVCVNYFDLDCNGMTEVCFPIEVDICTDPCSQEIYAAQIECGLWEFEVGNSTTVAEVSWFIPGNTNVLETHYIQHEFLSSGSQDVCVSYFDLICGEFVTQCITVEVDNCLECAVQMVFWEEECGTYYFEITGNQDIYGVEWDFGDGNFGYSQGPFITHTFSNNGDFIVCPWFWSQACPQLEDHCVEVAVDCEVNDQCSAITYEFINCEQAVFSYEGDSNGLYDQWQVSQNGVVILDYESMDDTTISFPSSGFYTVGVTDAIDCQGNIQPFYIEVFVEACPVCPQVFTEYMECYEGGFYFEGNISGNLYCWELWQNGSMLTTYFDQSFTELTFPGPGTYEVGVTNALGCDNEPVNHFITVVVDACGTESCGCVTNDNLLLNGDFEAGLPVNSDLDIDCTCQPGTVCLVSEPRDKCDNTYWVQDFYDHTYGTPNGNFLMVDGGEGNIWNDEVYVVAGETYNFSMWIVRELSDSPGNNSTQYLYTQINGFVHEEFSTADAPAGEWVEYCFDYTADQTGIITIALVQENGTGYNDWGLDDIYFGSCGETECQINLFTNEYECGQVEFIISAFASEGFISFGDGIVLDFEGSLIVHEYELAGWYPVCIEYYDEECDQWLADCVEVYVEGCEIECDLFAEVYALDCNSIGVNLSESLEFAWLDYGDGTYGDVFESFMIHEYEYSGWYTVCAEYYSPECEEGFFECTEIFIEGCEEECEPELTAVDLGCGSYEISVTEGANNIYMGYYYNSDNQGDVSFSEGQNSTQLQFEESGTYTIWTEYIHPDCEYYVGTEIQIEVNVCEYDCIPVTLTLEGDFGELENVTELVSGVITDGEEVIWEGLIPLSTFITSATIELCIPPGCYTFEIENQNSLAIFSLAGALQSLETDDVNVNLELDLLNGDVAAEFGVNSDCALGVNELKEEFLMYPVPTSDVIHLQFESSGWDIQVIDMTGRLVYVNLDSPDVTQIDATPWATGLYLVKASKGNSEITKKVEVRK